MKDIFDFIFFLPPTPTFKFRFLKPKDQKPLASISHISPLWCSLACMCHYKSFTYIIYIYISSTHFSMFIYIWSQPRWYKYKPTALPSIPDWCLTVFQILGLCFISRPQHSTLTNIYVAAIHPSSTSCLV